MAEVGAAVVAGDFGADHADAAVDVLVDEFFVVRCVKAWPAAAGVELGFRAEKRGIAADAVVGAVFVGVPIFTGEGAFGAFLAGDAVFGFIELGTPFGVGFFDFRHAGFLVVAKSDQRGRRRFRWFGSGETGRHRGPAGRRTCGDIRG